MIIENAHVDMHVQGTRELSSKRDVPRRATLAPFSVGGQGRLLDITARISFFLILLLSIGSIFYCHLLDDNFKLSILVDLRPQFSHTDLSKYLNLESRQILINKIIITMSEMKNPAVIVSLKEGGEFKCDLKVEERLVSNFITFWSSSWMSVEMARERQNFKKLASCA